MHDSSIGVVQKVLSDGVILSDGQMVVYAPAAACSRQFVQDDPVIFVFESCHPGELPKSTANLGILHAASEVVEYDLPPAEKLTGYICKIDVEKVYIRYGCETFCASQKKQGPFFQMGDFVEFEKEHAVMCILHPENAATAKRVTFIRKPENIHGDGKFRLIDSDGMFGILHSESSNSSSNIFVDVSVIEPSCWDLNEDFIVNTTAVKFSATEHLPHQSNHMTQFRCVEAIKIKVHDPIVLPSHSLEKNKDVDSPRNSPQNMVAHCSKSVPMESPQEVRKITCASRDGTTPIKQTLESGIPFRMPGRVVPFLPYKDSHMTRLETECAKLRILAHYMTEYKCKYCLENIHPLSSSVSSKYSDFL